MYVAISRATEYGNNNIVMDNDEVIDYYKEKYQHM
jgi:hypothetical protein